MKHIIRRLSSTQIILAGFLMLILLGSALLYLPISTESGEAVSYIDALFTATTATCVTGLVTVPTATTWSAFGQAVILVLIQIGGLGIITIVSGIMILLSKKIGIDNRVLIQDSFNLNSMSGIVSFIKKVIRGTFVIEACGALIYMTVFVPEFGMKGIWISVFNSISAFCNAGIDIIGENSLCDFALNPIVNATTATLIILGGIGFVVWYDVIETVKCKKLKSFRFLTLHSKIAITFTIFLIIAGAAMFLIFEYNNPNTIKDFSFVEKIEICLFQSITTRTAGFATIPQENMRNVSAIISMILMFIGGSPVGTAGGIKTVTFIVLIATAMSVIRNKRTVNIFGRQISEKTIKKSVAVFLISFAVVITAMVLLATLTDAALIDVMYETVSAAATVGLTRSFTGTLNTLGKAVIIATMYLGRVGPISIAVAFNVKRNSKNIVTNPIEEISVG